MQDIKQLTIDELNDEQLLSFCLVQFDAYLYQDGEETKAYDNESYILKSNEDLMRAIARYEIIDCTPNLTLKDLLNVLCQYLFRQRESDKLDFIGNTYIEHLPTYLLEQEELGIPYVEVVLFGLGTCHVFPSLDRIRLISGSPYITMDNYRCGIQEYIQLMQDTIESLKGLK